MAQKRFGWDMLERFSWTVVEFAAGLGVTELADLDVWWAAPIGVGLGLLKAFAAKNLGEKGTAATLPAAKDPAGGLPPVSTGSL